MPVYEEECCWAYSALRTVIVAVIVGVVSLFTFTLWLLRTFHQRSLDLPDHSTFNDAHTYADEHIQSIKNQSRNPRNDKNTIIKDYKKYGKDIPVKRKSGLILEKPHAYKSEIDTQIDNDKIKEEKENISEPDNGVVNDKPNGRRMTIKGIYSNDYDEHTFSKLITSDSCKPCLGTKSLPENINIDGSHQTDEDITKLEINISELGTSIDYENYQNEDRAQITSGTDINKIKEIEDTTSSRLEKEIDPVLYGTPTSTEQNGTSKIRSTNFILNDDQNTVSSKTNEIESEDERKISDDNKSRDKKRKSISFIDTSNEADASINKNRVEKRKDFEDILSTPEEQAIPIDQNGGVKREAFEEKFDVSDEYDIPTDENNNEKRRDFEDKHDADDEQVKPMDQNSDEKVIPFDEKYDALDKHDIPKNENKYFEDKHGATDEHDTATDTNLETKEKLINDVVLSHNPELDALKNHSFYGETSTSRESGMPCVSSCKASCSSSGSKHRISTPNSNTCFIRRSENEFLCQTVKRPKASCGKCASCKKSVCQQTMQSLKNLRSKSDSQMIMIKLKKLKSMNVNNTKN